MAEFKSRLRELRVRYSLSGTQVAQYFRIGKNTLYNWEKGNSEPSIEMLNKLATYYNVSVDYLTGKNDNLCFTKDDLYTELLSIDPLAFRKKALVSKILELRDSDSLSLVEMFMEHLK